MEIEPKFIHFEADVLIITSSGRSTIGRAVFGKRANS